ncbi:MAG: DUF192 domain-containing protein [Flavobacteriaceae bacterium]
MKLKGIFLILGVLFFFSACNNTPSRIIKEATVVFNVFKKEASLEIFNLNGELIKEYDIELADTPYERQTGLMYRTEMNSNHGMLFSFEDSALRTFYMKNTLISLDIIFLNESLEIISIYKNTTPNNESSIPSLVPAKYVLELRSGQSELNQFTEGMKINYMSYE